MPLPAADPWSAGIMAVGGVAQAALKPVGSEAHSTNSSSFDNSGFTVNVGGGSATSTKTALPTTAQAVGAAAAGFGSLLSNPAVIVMVGVGLFLYLKHK